MNPVLKYILAAGGGALVGSGITFVVTRKLTVKHWQEYANQQIEEVKEHYKIIRKEGEYADPTNLVELPDEELKAEEVVEAFTNPYAEELADDEGRKKDLEELAERIAAEGYDQASRIIGIAEDENVSLEVAIEVNAGRREESLFDKAIPEGPDGEPRDPEYPYVISIDEWAVPEGKYEAYEIVTITYYEGDETLLDSAEEIVMDKVALVGAEALGKFGYLSQDEDIVYVRNENLGLHIEIVRIKEGYLASKGIDFDPDEEDGFERQRRIKRNKARNSSGD